MFWFVQDGMYTGNITPEIKDLAIFKTKRNRTGVFDRDFNLPHEYRG